MRKSLVFLVCTGVGHVHRGYESFTEECFAALKNSTAFQLYLLKGGGPAAQQAIRVPCLQRGSIWTKKLARLWGTEAYFIEQFSFFLAMLPLLLWYQPKVIYYSDFKLGTWLWQLRRFLQFRYQLLFSNGAPNGPPFSRMDHVQQLLPCHYTAALKAGASAAQMTVLPYAFNLPPLQNLTTHKTTYKIALHLPIEKKIIVSVGAVNCYHKRMDYVVKEFAQLDTTQYHLVILGQIEAESPQVIQLAQQMLPENTYLIQQVSAPVVRDYLLAADYFVLASLQEGFGRVLIEALGAGLLPIVHQHVIMQEALQNYGVYVNMEASGSLLKGIDTVNAMNPDPQVLWQYAYRQYDWAVLKPRYEQLIHSLIH